MLLRYLLKEFRNSPRFIFFFLLNASIGLTTLLCVLNFRDSFQYAVSQRAKGILGADLVLEVRHELPQEQIDIAEKLLAGDIVKSHPFRELYSMATYGELSRLVKIIGVTEDFPFYGKVSLDDKYELKEHLKTGKAYVYPELRDQLNLKVGDEILLGDKNFIIGGIVTEDSSQSWQGTSLAPKIYVHVDEMAETSFLQRGSTVDYGFAYKLKETDDEEGRVKEIELALTDNRIKVKTPRTAGERVARAMNYLTDFLSLVALVALFMACIGNLFLYQSYLSIREKDRAILTCIGLRPIDNFKLFIGHIVILGGLSAIIGILLSAVLTPAIQSFVQGFLPFVLETKYITLESCFIAFSIGIVGNILLSFIILLPFLRKKPHELLLSEGLQQGTTLSLSWGTGLSMFGLLFFYWLISCYLTRSIQISSIFMGVILLAIALFSPLGLLALKSLEGMVTHSKLSCISRQSILYLVRHKWASVSAFLTLLLGVFLFNLIPLIEKGVTQELSPSNNSQIPSLFLFDIQEEQVPRLKSFLRERNTELLRISPMVRGRMAKINGKPFEKLKEEALTREEERERRFRNRGVNITYQSEFEADELTFEGSFPNTSLKDPEGIGALSIEYRFAERLGINIGDKIEFDILGMPIEGVVTHLRKVKWTSFLPNFFIVFQPGVLDDAPKSYIAATGTLNSKDKASLQNLMAKDFPNISAVDLVSVIERLMGVLNQMGMALKIMSLICFVIGLFVLYALVRHQVYLRERDGMFMQLLGLSPQDLKKMFVREFFYLGLISGIFGVLLANIVSYLLAIKFFDHSWSFNYLTPVITLILVPCICSLLAFLAGRHFEQTKPMQLLQEFS